MRLAALAVLSETEVRQVHEASLEVLATCGVRIDHPGLLERLRHHGLDVDLAGQTVRFSRTSVEEALARVPPRFEVCDREGRPAFVLGDGDSRVAAGHNAVFWVDSATGQTRPSRVADVELFARICDDLACLHMIGVPVMPQDVPRPAASLLYGLRAVIANSRKPVYFSTDNAAVNRACIRLLEAAFGGDLREQVYGISQVSPTAPLYWERGATEAVLDTLTTNVPLAILPEPNAGVSAPYTLAGLLTVNNAEWLSGLVVTQLVRPGARVLYANSWTTTDMRSGAALVGATETSVCRIAGAQLGRFYRVPTHTTAPNSDNHAHDEQNAWEKTFSMLCAVGARNDLIVNCGMFACGMTCSHEQLILDEEIAAMATRIAGGVDVRAETLATDLICATGARGSYLTTDHTLRWLRSGEHLPPRVSVRGPLATWAEAGRRDAYELARERVRRYAQAPNPAPLDPERQARLDAIIDGFA